MINIGRFNTLKILKQMHFGLYLVDTDGNEILLPEREVPENWKLGDDIEVFLYYDSEDRLIATTEKPLAKVGDFTMLKVVSVNSIGAFLDWGLPKDLFLPYAEQTRPLREGLAIAVAIYKDNTDRIAASMRLDRHTSKNPSSFVENQKVDLFIVGKSDLGFKAIINDEQVGVLYENEVFQDIHYGQRTVGYIKNVREDGKIDLSLQPLGSFGAKDLGDKILEILKAAGGSLPVTDKTSPEDIYEQFGASKKKFKMALGGLYKSRAIIIDDKGIRLAPK
ncbi:MAG: GntR family transcriptional regulator [Bdellovibrionaceae bacterium]|nr:GntR family transcriptional regulator [Pseudobdellovibrionaceae bacterium]